MTLLDRLDLLMEEQGIKKPQLAQLSGVPYTTIVGMYTKGYENTKLSTLRRLASALHTTINYLVGDSDTDLHPHVLAVAARYEKAPAKVRRAIEAVLDIVEEEPEEVILFPQKRLVPCYNSAAGTGDPEPDEQPEKIETDDPLAEWAVHISGNSMEPLLPDGSVAFGMNRKPQDGEVGAFRVDGMFTVKQVCVDSEGNTYLFATNRERSDSDQMIRYNSGRDLWCYGTILCDKVPLPD